MSNTCSAASVLQCWWDEEKAVMKKVTVHTASPSLSLYVLSMGNFTHPTLPFCVRIISTNPISLNLQWKCIDPLPAALWGVNQASSPRICSFTLALRASRDVRLRDLAAPIDKNPAFNVTQPSVRLCGAACSHGMSRMRLKRDLWGLLEKRAYLQFVWCKYLGVYFTGDDGHHLQFHIYRWHSPSQPAAMGLIKSLFRVKIRSRNATLGPV